MGGTRGKASSVVSILGMTIILGLISQSVDAQQATMQFPVERDNSILGWENHAGYGDPPEYDKFLETEEFSNHGAKVVIRARKSTQHAVIMDWNTNDINSFLASRADLEQPMSWTLNMYPLVAGPDDYTIETLESLNDWSEGNGGFFDFDDDGDTGSFENFNWEEGTTASTTNFAQTVYEIDADGDPALDPENSLPWVDNDFGTGGIDGNQYSVLGRGDHYSAGQRIPDYINSELLLSADLDDAAFDGTYASVPLDNDLVNALLTDEHNRGIILGPDGVSNDNWQVFSRENDGSDGMADPLPGPWASFLEVTYTTRPSLAGDFDRSGILDLPDVNLLNVAIANQGHDATFDLNADGLVDRVDLGTWVRELRQTWFGDANLDGEFDSADLVVVFAAGKFEDAVDATWDDGDWTGDRRFDSGDLVMAFQDGGYEQGPRMPAGAVPEPASWVLLLVGLIGIRPPRIGGRPSTAHRKTAALIVSPWR